MAGCKCPTWQRARSARSRSRVWSVVESVIARRGVYSFHSVSRSAANQVAMAMAPTATALSIPPRFSTTFICRPRCARASWSSEHHHTQAARHEPGAHNNNAVVSLENDGISRRGAMISAVVPALLLFIPEDSKAADSGNPFNKYLKRKKLDPLDTYVPTVVLAQLQFQDVDGKLDGEKPEFSDARSLLRSGPAGSLRSDIRAVAQYAAEAGNGKTANEAVDQCLRALEDLDSLLLRATRDNGSVSVDTMKTRVSTAVTALDKLLATVPSNILEKGKEIASAYRDQSTPGSDDNIGFGESPDELKGLL